MTEFRLAFSPSVPAGRVVFRVVNAGKLPHSFLLFPEDEDAPPLDEQLHGSDRRAVFPVAAIFTRAPGKGGTIAVQLAAGQRYGLMSPTVGAGDTPDFLKGMNAEFRAGPAPGPKEASRG
jgi:hypothetical protein